eukprot:CAMPEP_0176024430 /NCGR_PEP_ID=MMETSP0120_2-20121206/11938_1 /TAXON_ID=160619 /ORGANISM="Kryptoperidinium foliaceum, Strain CCMP 1326" /LENGTH=171 /DNA_ID=CAMNT_0017357609 /DNA_START=239 /DNA_END=754 /DNA_ORIENTATION=-
MDHNRKLHLRVRHEIVDSQHAARGMFDAIQPDQPLQALNPCLVNPSSIGIHEEIPHHWELKIGAPPQDEVAACNHEAIHEERQHNIGVWHMVLNERRIEHAVRKMDRRLRADPLLHTCGLALEIIEAHHFVKFVDLVSMLATAYRTGPIADDQNSRTIKFPCNQSIRIAVQ